MSAAAAADSSVVVDIHLPVKHTCSAKCATVMVMGIIPRRNHTYNPETQTCGEKDQTHQHRSPLVVACTDDLWEPIGSFSQPNEIVIPDTTITVRINYPLRTAVTESFSQEGGFSRKALVHAIRAMYERIYAEEDKSTAIPVGTVSANVMNRNTTDGVHGIWGHVLEDLWLEGIQYHPSQKLVTLSIRS